MQLEGAMLSASREQYYSRTFLDIPDSQVVFNKSSLLFDDIEQFSTLSEKLMGADDELFGDATAAIQALTTNGPKSTTFLGRDRQKSMQSTPSETTGRAKGQRERAFSILTRRGGNGSAATPPISAWSDNRLGSQEKTLALQESSSGAEQLRDRIDPFLAAVEVIMHTCYSPCT